MAAVGVSCDKRTHHDLAAGDILTVTFNLATDFVRVIARDPAGGTLWVTFGTTAPTAGTSEEYVIGAGGFDTIPDPTGSNSQKTVVNILAPTGQKVSVLGLRAEEL